MHYDSLMNHLDWDGLRLLLAVVDAGSLRGAADTLSISQPTLGRRLRALESAVGAPLLLRHARGVTLTDAGRATVALARGLSEQLTAHRRALAGHEAEATGRVRLACTEPVGEQVIAPILGSLRARHPALGVDLVVSATASDLDRREADLAVRMFRPTQPNLIARRVGGCFTAFYASRAYVARRGRPADLIDLATHDGVGPDRIELFVRQAGALGVDLEQLAYRTDSPAVTRALVRAGAAIGALLGPMADADPALVRVMGPIAEHEVWLVTHPDLWTSRPVRAVWDHLAAHLPEALSPRTGPPTS